MKMLALIAVFASVLSGCIIDFNNDGTVVIGCLGDSNTDENYIPVSAPTWCSRLATLNPNLPGQPWTMENFGVSYSTAILPADQPDDVLIASRELTVMLNTSPKRPDIVIFAYGTNDVRFDGVSPAAIVLALAAVDSQAAMAGISQRWIALIPPFSPCSTETLTYGQMVQDTNALLLQAFPGRTIDLYTGFDDVNLFLDAVHFNADGQARRAQVIFDTLK